MPVNIFDNEYDNEYNNEDEYEIKSCGDEPTLE